MANPDAYLFYWGHAFQGHDSVLAALNESFARLYDTRYKQFLQEYSVTGGQLAGVFTDFGDPPSDVGAADFPAVIAFVINKSLSTSAPTFWYTVGGHDPIYVIFVVDDHNLDKASWGGYHFWALTAAEMVIPFPFSLLVHDALPFEIVKVPENALTLPLEGLLFRDNCTPLAPCAPLAAFDEATVRAAHEFVETSTDPYPFFGWSDPLRQPVWEDGELADICRNKPLPWGSKSRVGNTVVATYWSNTEQACVPESRPSVSILEPAPGATIPWHAGGAGVFLEATATDPVDGPLQNICWKVDGIPRQIPPQCVAPSMTASALTLGPHTFTAEATDSQGLKASATVTAIVVAQPPIATIFSPADGATFGTDETVVFRGDGFDFQDYSLPESVLVWQVNGSVIGTGRVVMRKISGLGAASIDLTVTNSAGLSATAHLTLHIIAPTGKPSITITLPANGAQFAHGFGTAIPFTATATDVGGVPLTGTAIRWTDDLDGFLGTGENNPHTLSGGTCSITRHHVTATVTNTSGQSASDAIFVDVGYIC